MQEFEKIEQGFFRKILAAHSKTPVECLYLELGIVPFRFKVMTRRVMYFHNLMNREDEELTKKVLLLQMDRNYKGDVGQQIKKDLVLIASLSLLSANIALKT